MISLTDQKRWKTSIINGEYVIRGKFGQVALYEDGDLDVWICTWERHPDKWDEAMKRSYRRSRFVERKGWKATQHYDDGALFIRPPSDLDRACLFIKANRKRFLGIEQRKEAIRRLARYAYSKKTLAPQVPQIEAI